MQVLTCPPKRGNSTLTQSRPGAEHFRRHRVLELDLAPCELEACGVLVRASSRGACPCRLAGSLSMQARGVLVRASSRGACPCRLAGSLSMQARGVLVRASSRSASPRKLARCPCPTDAAGRLPRPLTQPRPGAEHFGSHRALEPDLAPRELEARGVPVRAGSRGACPCRLAGCLSVQARGVPVRAGSRGACPCRLAGCLSVQARGVLVRARSRGACSCKLAGCLSVQARGVLLRGSSRGACSCKLAGC
jgi:hypothetical protein